MIEIISSTIHMHIHLDSTMCGKEEPQAGKLFFDTDEINDEYKDIGKQDY